MLARLRTEGSSWAAWAILACSLVATAVVAQFARNEVEANALRDFSFIASEVVDNISNRLGNQEKLLRAGAALYESTDQLSRETWNRFVARQLLEKYLPGAIGLGIGAYVPREALASHEQGLRAQGFAGYHVWPEGGREAYAPAVQLEPFEGNNRRPFGYDMLSEPVRRAALERTRDTGEVALTGKVFLRTDPGHSPLPATLMYLAVYRQGAHSGSVEGRRGALRAWVYHPYRVRDLMRGMLGGWETHERGLLRLRLYDGAEESERALLHDSAQEGSLLGPPQLSLVRTIDFGGARWTLRFDRVRPLDYLPAWRALGAGLSTSLLLFALALSLLSTQRRARALATQLTADLRDSERQQELALRGGDLGLWDLRLPSGRLTFNDRWFALFGFARGELPDTAPDLALRVHPDDLIPGEAAMNIHLRGEAPHYQAEYRFRHKDGRWIWTQARGEVLERDAAGTPVRVVGVQRDISEQKRAEQELLESERRLLQMLAKMQETEALLRDSLREKEALVKEVHHRVKNNLQVMVSLLGLQLDVTGDEGAASALRDSQERIRSMALIHEQLYRSADLSRINLARYVRDLVAGLTTVFRRAGASKVEVLADELWVQIDTAIPCGLILSELVSNALKYALHEGSPGVITVALHAQGSQPGARTLTLVVEDDGPGLPAAVELARAGSLGLRLVQILAKQLHGAVASEAGHKGGARFTVTLREKGSSMP